MNRFLLCIAMTVLAARLSAGTIHVPADQPTIQAAINVAANGDIVLVAPGTYQENIDFSGKAIKVTSSNGPAVTIIDGGKVAPVATFISGESQLSVLSRFTIQNGTATFSSSYDGGGIYISNSSPTISGNIIQNNTACNGGGGVAVEFSSAVLRGNVIRNNSQAGCSGGTGGGGINVGGAGSVQLIGNTIENNSWGSGGGGISLFAAGTPTLMNNIIRGNSAPGSQGGGIAIANDADALILQNVFYSNNAAQGGAIYFLVPSGYRGPYLVNNTFAANSASQGAAVYADGFDSQVLFYNNLLVGPTAANAVYCDGTYSQTPPTFYNNDAYSPIGSGLQGTCASQAATNGNISVNPRFVNAGGNNFRLQSISPAVDAGLNSAPSLPAKDLVGKPRIVDQDHDGNPVVDMGAYELQ